jgi:hypothetical protein
MANNFFSGCETWMEDAPVQEDGTSIAEVIESVTQASEEIEQDHEFTHEINTLTATAATLDARAAELERMVAYVKTYGVDRSFLHLCDYGHRLSSIGVSLPACESFDVTGNPNSAESQAALEGLRTVAANVWERIKRFFARMLDWAIRLIKMYDIRQALLNSKIDKAKEALKKVTVDKIDNDETISVPKIISLINGQKMKEFVESLSDDKATAKYMTDIKESFEEVGSGQKAEFKLPHPTPNLLTHDTDMESAKNDFEATQVKLGALADKVEVKLSDFTKSDLDKLVQSLDSFKGFVRKAFQGLGVTRKWLQDINILASHLGGDDYAMARKFTKFVSRLATYLHWKVGTLLSVLSSAASLVITWSAAAGKSSKTEEKK